MRLLVQAVGARVTHQYDRPWARGGGARRPARRHWVEGTGSRRGGADPARISDASARDHLHHARRDRRAGRSAASRRARWSCCPSPTATCPASPRRGRIERDALPSVRLAHLRDLRHPMSVDLWIDRVGAHAKVILVRLLGGLDWWRYGVDRLVGARARARHRAGAAARARIATIRGSRKRRPLPAHELDRAARLFPRRRPREPARAAAAARAPRRRAPARRPSRSRCRAWRAICRASARSSSTELAGERSCRVGRWCRSSSIARCCSPPTRRRSTLCARRWRRAVLRRRRS